MAEQRSAALLESALHEASGPDPRIYLSSLASYEILHIQFDATIRLIDLRDPALDNLGIDRAQISNAAPQHYRCTQAVAAQLVDSKGTCGFVWTSRQGTMHAQRNSDGLASEVLRHTALDAAIVYSPDYQGMTTVLQRWPLVVDSQPIRFVRELANLLRIPIV